MRRDISDSESDLNNNFGTMQVYDLFNKLVRHMHISQIK